jgi:4'-phosphopantetheinyl transferase
MNPLCQAPATANRQVWGCLPLHINQVDLWYAIGPLGQAAAERCRRWLGSDELARYTSFRLERDRYDYLLAHGLLRAVLSLYVPLPPGQWRFRPGPFGKPEIDAPGLSWLRFNLSHTFDLAAVAVSSGREIGVDVEYQQRPVEPDLARAALAGKEYRQLQQSARRDWRQAFFDFWTLKEAYLKACGLGLTRSLQDFAFVLSPGRSPRIEFGSSVDDCPERWQFWQHRPFAAYRAAVAVCRPSDDEPSPSALCIRHLNVNESALLSVPDLPGCAGRLSGTADGQCSPSHLFTPSSQGDDDDRRRGRGHRSLQGRG